MNDGDDAGKQRLWELLYPELHKIAQSHLAKERPGHTLQPTALVNEAFLKLADQSRVQWKGRKHFLVIAAAVMRRILVDHARQRLRGKRGGGAQRVELTEDMAGKLGEPEDVLAIDDAMRKLQELDERQARIVELRFFGGFTVPEVADLMNLSTRLVEGEWQMIRAWLRRELASGR
jgi:RNA polymerase sigma factor (TIGR02999 family)